MRKIVILTLKFALAEQTSFLRQFLHTLKIVVIKVCKLNDRYFAFPARRSSARPGHFPSPGAASNEGSDIVVALINFNHYDSN